MKPDNWNRFVAGLLAILLCLCSFSIYEDNVSGKISDERFSRMSRRYEDEQKELTEKIKQLRSEIEKQSSRTMTTDMFISLVRKYTRAKKLTPRMLNELVEKIEVFNA